MSTEPTICNQCVNVKRATDRAADFAIAAVAAGREFTPFAVGKPQEPIAPGVFSWVPGGWLSRDWRMALESCTSLTCPCGKGVLLALYRMEGTLTCPDKPGLTGLLWEIVAGACPGCGTVYWGMPPPDLEYAIPDQLWDGGEGDERAYQ